MVPDRKMKKRPQAPWFIAADHKKEDHKQDKEPYYSFSTFDETTVGHCKDCEHLVITVLNSAYTAMQCDHPERLGLGISSRQPCKYYKHFVNRPGSYAEILVSLHKRMCEYHGIPWKDPK